jgi:peptidoglycan/LPS O-acetylase OafA/YrhL
MKYRAEIDGLRTVAVLPVILFHSGLLVFGGYVGVDIFFVISGFLITTNVASEIQDGTFTIVRFYERRARRIMPALLLVLILCTVAALLLSSKQALGIFSHTLMWVTAFAGNIYFWKTASYFDTSSNLNPLLHTWSLAVEEQYYLFFPLLLMAGWKRFSKWTFGILAAIAIASFFLSDWASTHTATANFYLLPFRFWELLAGSLAALWRLRKGLENSYKLHNVLSIAGFLLIAYSLWAYSDDTPFPGRYALAPVLGSVLIVLFARQGTIVGKFLSWSPMVLIGKISYSAYLWHQPLFAFARQIAIDKPRTSVMVGLSLLSLCLAYLSWRFVESPFRARGVSRQKIFAFTGMGIALCFAAGWFATVRAAGMQLSPLEQRMSQFEGSEIPLRRSCFLDSSTQPPDQFQSKCRAGESEPTKIMVWGDSHAAALAAGFAPHGYQIIQYTANSCPPLYGDYFPGGRYCWQINQFVLSEIGRIKPDFLVLDGYWRSYRSKVDRLLPATLNLIRQQSPATRIIVVGEAPLWQSNLPTILARRGIDLTGEARLPNALLDESMAEDAKLKSEIGPNVDFVSALDVLCSAGGCLVVGQTVNGQYQPMAYDYGHLSQAGAEKVAQKILEVANVGRTLQTSKGQNGHS